MNIEAISQIMHELGIQDATDVLSKKEVNTEEVVSRIREGQRVYLQSHPEFIQQFEEMGRQNVLQEFYKKSSDEFQLNPDLVTNKPIEDILKLGVSKIRENMSAGEKKAEEMITTANRKAYDLENTTIPQIRQQYERQISEIHMNSRIRELVQSCQNDMTHPIDVVLPFILSRLSDKSQYSVNLTDVGISINDGSNNVIRNKTKTEILTPKDVIRKVLEEGKFLKTTPNPPNQMQQQTQQQQAQQRTILQQQVQQQQDYSPNFIPEAIQQAEQNLAKLRMQTR